MAQRYTHLKCLGAFSRKGGSPGFAVLIGNLGPASIRRAQFFDWSRSKRDVAPENPSRKLHPGRFNDIKGSEKTFQKRLSHTDVHSSLMHLQVEVQESRTIIMDLIKMNRDVSKDTTELITELMSWVKSTESRLQQTILRVEELMRAKERPRYWLRRALQLLTVLLALEFFGFDFGYYVDRLWGTSPVDRQVQTPVKGMKLLYLEPGSDAKPVVCAVHPASEIDHPSYEALSYRCGDQSIRRSILLSGNEDTVGVNLYTALAGLRDPKVRRILWVDELCINQRDPVERREQVAMMGDIYSNAQRVLVWLGDSDDSTIYAFDTLRKLHAFFHTDPLRWLWIRTIRGGKVLEMVDRDAFLQDRDWRPLIKLLSNQYFTRTWIVQEIARSRDIMVVCGKDTMRWSTFISTIKDMVGFEIVSLISTPRTQLAISHLYSIWELHRAYQSKGSAHYPLVELYKATSTFECGDLRDRIFGIWSMAKDVNPNDQSFRPDYTLDPVEVSMRFAERLIMKQKNLAHLSWSHVSHFSDGSDDSSRLPSWVPDNTGRGKTTSLSQAYYGSASGDSEIQASIDASNGTLRILGRRVCAIQQTARTPAEVTSARNKTKTIDRPASEASDDPVLQIEAASNWISEARSLSKSWLDEISLNRTMTCASNYMQNGLSLLHYVSLFQLTRELKKETQHSEGEKSEQLIYSKLLIKHWTTSGQGIRRAARAIQIYSKGRRLAVTSRGGFACVPEQSQVGDVVCVLYGGRVPYVLRPLKDGGYRILGGAYVDGMMYGKALKIKGIEDEVFVLR